MLPRGARGQRMACGIPRPFRRFECAGGAQLANARAGATAPSTSLTWRARQARGAPLSPPLRRAGGLEGTDGARGAHACAAPPAADTVLPRVAVRTRGAARIPGAVHFLVLASRARMARAGAAFGGVTQTVAYCLGERDGEASSALVGGALGCCWPLLPSMSDKELRIPSRLGRAVRLPAAGALGATLGLLAWRLCRSAPVVEFEPCAQPGRRVAGEELADPWDGPARRSSRGAE